MGLFLLWLKGLELAIMVIFGIFLFSFVVALGTVLKIPVLKDIGYFFDKVAITLDRQSDARKKARKGANTTEGCVYDIENILINPLVPNKNSNGCRNNIRDNCVPNIIPNITDIPVTQPTPQIREGFFHTRILARLKRLINTKRGEPSS